MNIQIQLSPHGRLVCAGSDDPAGGSMAGGPVESAIRVAFGQSSADGLLYLARPAESVIFSPQCVFWREWASRFLQTLCQLDDKRLDQFTRTTRREALAEAIPVPDRDALNALIGAAPPMRGLEYLTPETLEQLWLELAERVRSAARETEGGLTAYLRDLNPFWHMLGRVTFHLAENKRDERRPFAFLATFAHRLSSKASVQHLPLSEALRQYIGARDQAKLAELLAPVRAAADRSALVREWLDSRALFHPQALTIDDAYRFLRDVPLMEQCGLVVRVPNWWQTRKPPRPSIQVHLGKDAPSGVGVEGLLDFSVELALDGQPLTDDEQRKLLAAASGLMLLRGKWVEVDRDRLKQALAQWQDLQRAHAGGIDFLKGMRLLAGAELGHDAIERAAASEWIHVRAGDWLRQALTNLRDPRGVLGCTPGDGLRATLRPYQADGVRWLWFMTQLRLGACLADDMGLGKTVQVIDLLLRMQVSQSSQPGRAPRTSLLIVPASLLGNWKQELERFAPQIRVSFAHRSEAQPGELEHIEREPQKALADIDLLITTYTYVRRADWVAKFTFRLVVLDEAQAIKNESSAQTKAAKAVRAEGRIVLTGTPVENQLGDLWSLFDFCCPGLLGTMRQFKDYVKRLNERQDAEAYGALRRLVQPYILRRLKTDPNIAPDLPEKTEMRVECGLSRVQAALYQQVVTDFAKQLQALKEKRDEDGIQRRGIVLATMLRLKQICNHPSQYLGQPEFQPDDSGKFERLAAICEPIAERQEKVLVFTQFQSLCEPLVEFIQAALGRAGLVLHGGVPVGKRKELVRRFQEDDSLLHFVISVKAGGTGLNLTAASHVIHFDRWWNPAVENQATDRAFRIGQKRNVLVHKFVCRGTLEERIDQMIRGKQELADKILGPTREGETLLTEMSDQELLKFVALDITRTEL